jgi:SAM-dependent methyltransferase
VAFSFNFPADAYDRFMGRYSVQLSPQLADLAGVKAGQRVVDVGCGPGALTQELVTRVGVKAVSAAEPSGEFVAAVTQRLPGIDVRQAPAEELPFADGEFDAALAQLVVHFMADPVRGVSEMKRVTRAGGVVAASVWDFGTEQSPLGPFWRVAHELDPELEGESDRVGGRQGQLGELFTQVGLDEVEETALPVHVEHATFDDWWEPFTLGAAPAGAYFNRLDPERQAELRQGLREHLGESFTIPARAWAARGVAR